MTDLEKFEEKMRGKTTNELREYVEDVSHTVNKVLEHFRERVQIVLKIANERIANESKNNYN